MAFEKFGKMIGNIASTTAKKAGEQAQIAKLGLDRAGIERQIEGVYAAMGRFCYSKIKEGEVLPEQLNEYCRDIDTLKEQLKELEDNIAAHKEARDAAEYTVSEDFKDLTGGNKAAEPEQEYVAADLVIEAEPVVEVEAEAVAEPEAPAAE